MAPNDEGFVKENYVSGINIYYPGGSMSSERLVWPTIVMAYDSNPGHHVRTETGDMYASDV